MAATGLVAATLTAVERSRPRPRSQRSRRCQRPRTTLSRTALAWTSAPADSARADFQDRGAFADVQGGDRRRSRRHLGRGLGRMDRRRSGGRDRKGRGDRGGRGHDRKGEGSGRRSRSPGCFLVGSTRTHARRGQDENDCRTKKMSIF